MTHPDAVPFPVSTPYRIRSDVAPLEGPITVRDEHAAAYADAKRELLGRVPARCRVVAAEADPAGVAAALMRFAGVAAREQGSDALAELENAGRAQGPVAHGAGDEGWTRDDVEELADAVALAVQEDVVVMREDLGAELLHVCFPSHWDPSRHAGSSLEALHGPVPHGGRLRGASTNLLKAMIEKGPFERHVWSVNTVGTLHRHPDEPRPAPADAPLLPQLFFRVERQTTLPLPDLRRSVFAIRIFQAPLPEVLSVEPDRAAELADAVASMDEVLRVYKGIVGFADRLLDELRAFRPEPGSSP